MVSEVTLMLTTLPDLACARKLAADVLQVRLAACVTEFAVVRSLYHWQGQVETAEEIPLLFKTSLDRSLELERFIRTHHPYETPEILCWQASALPAYGQWVAAETRRSIHV